MATVVKQRAFWIAMMLLALCALAGMELARTIYLAPSHYAVVLMMPVLLAGLTSVAFFLLAFRRSRQHGGLSTDGN